MGKGDNLIQGNQIYYALKLADDDWDVSNPQRCTSDNTFCITECGGKILVVDHKNIDYESNTKRYDLNIQLIQNQYTGGSIVPTVIDSSGQAIVHVIDVNEPPSRYSSMEFSPTKTPPETLRLIRLFMMMLTVLTM